MPVAGKAKMGTGVQVEGQARSGGDSWRQSWRLGRGPDQGLPACRCYFKPQNHTGWHKPEPHRRAQASGSHARRLPWVLCINFGSWVRRLGHSRGDGRGPQPISRGVGWTAGVPEWNYSTSAMRLAQGVVPSPPDHVVLVGSWAGPGAARGRERTCERSRPTCHLASFASTVK